MKVTTVSSSRGQHWASDSWLLLLVLQVWSHKDFPLIPVGKLVLNRNPTNYFAEVEQLAFDPSNMPPGIEASPDKMLQVRAARHRHLCCAVLQYCNIPTAATTATVFNKYIYYYCDLWHCLLNGIVSYFELVATSYILLHSTGHFCVVFLWNSLCWNFHFLYCFFLQSMLQYHVLFTAEFHCCEKWLEMRAGRFRTINIIVRLSVCTHWCVCMCVMCRAASSPTPTPTATGWAPTTCRSPSTAPSEPGSATTSAMGPCASLTIKVLLPLGSVAPTPWSASVLFFLLTLQEVIWCQCDQCDRSKKAFTHRWLQSELKKNTWNISTYYLHIK